MESVESQGQASPSFHKPLGNLAKRKRASHISTAPATRADGKVENQKQVFHFPTAPNQYRSKKRTGARAGASPSAARRVPRRSSLRKIFGAGLYGKCRLFVGGVASILVVPGG